MSNKFGHNFYKPQKWPSFYPHIQCYKRTNPVITNILELMKFFMLRVKDSPCFYSKIVKICHKDWFSVVSIPLIPVTEIMITYKTIDAAKIGNNFEIVPQLKINSFDTKASVTQIVDPTRIWKTGPYESSDDMPLVNIVASLEMVLIETYWIYYI